MRIRRSSGLIALAIFASLIPARAGAEALCPDAPQANSLEDHVVTSFDGTGIAITAFRPADVCTANPAPVVLTLHGWGGSRSDALGDEADLLNRGYGVVAIDSRGNGESGGKSLVHHPSQEVKDFQAVLDWIYDELDWVMVDDHGSKDVRVGARGGSYGGGFQLMIAAFDDRLDAIMPDHTWHHLPRSLAPNGAIKLFVSLLYASGKASKTLDERLDRWYAEAMATNRFPAEAYVNFLESSPATYDIDVPAFFTQGMVDTLFPLNEAVSNFVEVRDNGRPAWLVGLNNGHTYPGLQPMVLPDLARGNGACFNVSAAKYDFLAAFLKDDAGARARMDALPRVSLATEQGGCFTAADWPPASNELTLELPALALPQGGGSLLIPIERAGFLREIVGAPRFQATVPAGVEETFYLSLVQSADGTALADKDLRLVQDQVTGVRSGFAAINQRLDIEMSAIATRVLPDDLLFLRIDAANEQYLQNGQRRAGATVLTDVVLRLPVV